MRRGKLEGVELRDGRLHASLVKATAKRQQTLWTKRDAHPLLQTGTRTLDGLLRPLFKRWYPGLANNNGNEAVQAAAA